MNLVEKALWYIETHSAASISLEHVAAACAVSRFHMARAFGLATGWPVMRYVRGRRLSDAARALSLGAPDILIVALDAGYGSHEAFTRAFRDQFGVTPESVRQRGDPDNLTLVEPIKMSEGTNMDLEEPRREAGPALTIVGLRARYSLDTVAGIPGQWQRFGPHLAAIPARIGGMAYGVCCEFDDAGHYDYVCGVAVSRLTEPPPELIVVRLPAREYLVFRHTGHVASISRTWRAIMNDWLPASSYRMDEAPAFERYAEDFDGNTGLGGVEIWLPVAV